MSVGRFVIADPSLVDGRGHHYSLTLQVTRGAQALGLEVLWWTHRDFAATAPAGVEICKLFSATMYDRYRPEAKARLSADAAARVLEEIEAGIERCRLGPDDLIYFHTGFGDVICALPGFAGRADWNERPALHVCTPYDLATMPGKDSAAAVADALHGLRALEATERKVFLWTETPQLAVHYTLVNGFNARALPLPSPAESSAAPRSGDQVVALYLGAAREEKGFTDLPALAERLYEPLGRSGRLRFAVQCTPQIIGYRPVIKAAIERLRALPAGYVELIDQVMTEADYHRRLVDCDVVLLLYDAEAYRLRGSGIAVEAVSTGRCLLTRSDTFCASLLTDGGGVALRHAEDAATALSDICARIDEYRERAIRQGAAYRATNSVSRYVQRLLTVQRRSARFLPSALLGEVHYPLLRL